MIGFEVGSMRGGRRTFLVWLVWVTTPCARGNQLVTMERAVRVSTTEGLATAVTLRYEFPLLTEVYLSGVGRLPASGALDLLVLAPSLVFRNVTDGSVLTVVDLQDAMVTMGRATLEIPNVAKFPPASRRGQRRSGTPPMAIAARRILEASLFRSGVVSLEINGLPAVLTPYAELAREDSRPLARIALLLTFDGSLPQFDLHYLVQERRSHTAWRDEISSETLSRAQAQVESLFAALEE